MNDRRYLLVAALVGATLSTGVSAGVIGGALAARAEPVTAPVTAPVAVAVPVVSLAGAPRPCSDRLDYSADPRDDATIDALGAQRGACPTPVVPHARRRAG